MLNNVQKLEGAYSLGGGENIVMKDKNWEYFPIPMAIAEENGGRKTKPCQMFSEIRVLDWTRPGCVKTKLWEQDNCRGRKPKPHSVW